MKVIKYWDDSDLDYMSSSSKWCGGSELCHEHLLDVEKQTVVQPPWLIKGVVVQQVVTIQKLQQLKGVQKQGKWASPSL